MAKRISRRGFIGTTLAAAVSAKWARAQEALRWRNWSGSVQCSPQAIERPTTEAQVVELIRKAVRENWTVRAYGSGHSFTPLCRTEGLALSLAEMQGVVDADLGKLEATVLGGTRMARMHKPLREAGLAMENISDIDRQAITGAIATSTHGTGHGIRSISNQVVGLRLVTASGDVIDCSPHVEREIFKAAQVSLGALGVITQARMRFMPKYKLHEKGWTATFDEIFEKLDEHIAENRHFEFFWVSQGDRCAAKTLNVTDRDPLNADEEAGLEGERIGWSDEIFPSIRSRRFNEIEYSVPEEHGPDCLLELRELMRTKYPDIVMPLEYRTVGSDDIPLSMMQGRETVTISAHQLGDLPYEDFFGDCEAIFGNHEGRPHWGKIHTRTASELEALYPKWDEFQEVRRRLDPKGRFMNGHLREILG